jgi:tRNA threonylcarbamoyladenosine biosynthesis protein TsaB
VFAGAEQLGGMIVLGFDTATPDTVVALTREGEVVAEATHGPDPSSGRPVHATALLVEVERAVSVAGGWAAIDRIAVGLGPGSFTGLRVGIAAARALARARDLPLVGIGTLAVLASGIREFAPDRADSALAVTDARRGEAFATLHGGDGHELWEPFVTTPDELAGHVRELEQAPIAAGDGSLRFRRQLEEAGARVPDASSPAHRVSARRLCLLAEATDATPPGQVQPIYLRRPDAEIWRERQSSGR